MCLNLTKQRIGAQQEQQLLHQMFERMRTQFCERVEIAPLMVFSQYHNKGIKCQNRTSDGRYLNLFCMLQHCCNILQQHTKFWPIDQIIDYSTLNVAACLAVYHATLYTISDVSLPSYVRAQHCETMVYTNQLLRTHKDGKLYKKVRSKLSKSVRGKPYNRELMLPLIPCDVFSRLSNILGVPYQRDVLVPVAADLVQIRQNSTGFLVDRIRSNKDKTNNFDTNVLRCEYCKRLFFGGKGENDVKLFQEHLSKFNHHRLPKADKPICNTEWEYDFKKREVEMLAKYEQYYSREQRRAYDAVLKGQKNLVLMGVAGSGKSTLLQDIKYLLECVFWKKGEIRLCGATNAVSQRMGIKASSFHSFLGLKPMQQVSFDQRWNLTVDHCLTCMNRKKAKLKTCQVVILEEGLEIQSNILEAYFRYVSESEWPVITLINGDVCQGTYREDDSTGQAETSFFAKEALLADICPSLDIHTFTEDHRTKDLQLRAAKTAVRNATATPQVLQYLQALRYEEGKTEVDIILCARIKDMVTHNQRLLNANPNPLLLYTATSTSKDKPRFLNYKHNGVYHVLSLKKGAPIMIVQNCKASTSNKTTLDLGPGTLGIVEELLPNSVKIQVPELGKRVIVEIKAVQVLDTQWKQIPVVLCFASTIAKCIGFEFERVAIDF